MDQHQRELRRASAKAFLESLDQLNETLHAPAPTPKPIPARPTPAPSSPKKTKPRQFTLAELEDALADIEQFMENKNPKPPESTEES